MADPAQPLHDAPNDVHLKLTSGPGGVHQWSIAASDLPAASWDRSQVQHTHPRPVPDPGFLYQNYNTDGTPQGPRSLHLSQHDAGQTP